MDFPSRPTRHTPLRRALQSQTDRRPASTRRPGLLQPRRRWRLLLIAGVILSLMPLAEIQPLAAQRPAMDALPAGLSAQDWQAIRAQLPARQQSKAPPQSYLKAANA